MMNIGLVFQSDMPARVKAGVRIPPKRATDPDYDGQWVTRAGIGAEGDMVGFARSKSSLLNMGRWLDAILDREQTLRGVDTVYR